MVCAKFVPVYKLLWDDSSAGDKPRMPVGTETGGIACLPPTSSLIGHHPREWRVVPPSFPKHLVSLILHPCVLGVTEAW